MLGDTQAPPGLRKTRLACVLNPFPTFPSYSLSSNSSLRATALLPLPHNPRPFVMSRAVEAQFGQR
jgi:hypothetical protein